MRHQKKHGHAKAPKATKVAAPSPATEVVAMSQEQKNEEKKPEALAATEHEPGTKASVVDTVFDVVTEWTVTGLRGTQRGLEVGARWLDARAKAVGELAQKLAQDEAAEQKQAA